MLSVVLAISVVALSVASSALGSAIGARAAPTPGSLRIVENSGVCETTPGVYQASGYGDFSSSDSLWFWFFEARHSPDTAPLTVWLQGEGGTSSMVGLLTENGPCRLSDDGNSVSLNPYSWNEVSNILYIDQPIGVGFSSGTRNITTSEDAAADVWKFLQIFFADSRFAKYQKNDFGIWSERYGGNLAPTFATYFLSQNDAIESGSASGVKINVKNIGIGGPFTDPLLQLPNYLDYAVGNSYSQLVTAGTILAQTRLWFATDNSGIQQKVQNCNAGGSNLNLICWDAVLAAQSNFVNPLVGNFQAANVNSNKTDPSTTAFLSRSDIQAKIGASGTYTETNIFVSYNFETTGTWIKNSRPLLDDLVSQNILVGIWAGDADFYGNHLVTESLVEALNPEFYFTQFNDFKVNGQTAGQVRQLLPINYVRFTGAGHNIGDFAPGSLVKGEAALQFFNQTIHSQSLS